MVELADATDSKSVGSDTVRVQVPLPPSTKKLFFIEITRPNGGIGRRGGLKIHYREVCGFESRFGHTFNGMIMNLISPSDGIGRRA